LICSKQLTRGFNVARHYPAHEILNPVNTISMSFQGLARELETRELDPEINSVRQATGQLERIVNSLTEAAHIEDTLKEDEFEAFDLAALVQEYASNARRLHPGYEFVYHGSGSGIYTTGSDLRIAPVAGQDKVQCREFREPRWRDPV
jgi:signal transduction histidine kinase